MLIMDEESLTEDKDMDEIADDEDKQYYKDQEIEDDTQGDKENDSGITATNSKDEEEEVGRFKQLDNEITREKYLPKLR